MLGELKLRQLEASTLVVLHSDHGYSLGEHGELHLLYLPYLLYLVLRLLGEWQNCSNFEHGTRVPTVLRCTLSCYTYLAAALTRRVAEVLQL